VRVHVLAGGHHRGGEFLFVPLAFSSHALELLRVEPTHGGFEVLKNFILVALTRGLFQLDGKNVVDLLTRADEAGTDSGILAHARLLLLNSFSERIGERLTEMVRNRE
jgi:hypothetical protein